MTHPGQFSILKKPLSLPDWQTLSLSGGWVLSFHKKLDVFYLPKHGLLLLGLAWQVLPGKPSPEQELRELSESADGPITDEQLMALEESWCGRYVLISSDHVFTDTCAMLQVFHSPAGIASDLTLLAEASGLEAKIYEPGRFMNWMPGPMTPYPEIMRVMPSQIYCYESGRTLPRLLLSAERPVIADDEERIRVFTDIFTCSLNNMRKRLAGRKLLMALTGGYDSRSLFALAKHAGLDFDAYTLEYDGIFTDDVSLPKELCRLTDTKHFYIPRDHSRYSSALEDEYLRHTAGLIRDADRLSYAHGQYQELVEPYGETVLLRSSVWENVIEYYGHSFKADGPGDHFYDWFCVRRDSPEQRSLEQYFDWHRAHPQPRLVASNIFLWEQREGCWLSAIESGFDLLEHAVTLQPANCRLLISMLLDFPLEERVKKEHQARIIRYACPEIADVPFCGKATVGGTPLSVALNKMSRVGYRIKTRGLANTLSLYIGMVKKKL